MQAAVQEVRKWQLYSLTEHVNAYFRTILYLAERVLYAWKNLQLAEHVYIILENPVSIHFITPFSTNARYVRCAINSIR